MTTPALTPVHDRLAALSGFDSVGHPPIEPATGGWDGDALVLERSSERGVNRTTLTLTGDVLEQEIAFRPASDGAAFGPLVRARYLRVS